MYASVAKLSSTINYFNHRKHINIATDTTTGMIPGQTYQLKSGHGGRSPFVLFICITC